MQEIFGELFKQKDADAICITTNGTVKRNGEVVMGRGCAREANRRWDLAWKLGIKIKWTGNVAVPIQKTKDYWIVGFPVKHNWWEKADLKLIEKSAKLLVEMVNERNWKKAVLPQPGCENGRLNWKDVKRVLEPILDDRFYVITNKKGE